MSSSSLDLLILDFDGVCTLSTTEIGAVGAAPPLADVVRPEATACVSDAQTLGITVVILSNEINPSWAENVPLLGQVDHLVSCADNGIYKPDRRAFQRCLLLTGSQAERTLVVDDKNDNVTVASSLGMQTVLFDPKTADASWEVIHTMLLT